MEKTLTTAMTIASVRNIFLDRPLLKQSGSFNQNKCKKSIFLK